MPADWAACPIPFEGETYTYETPIPGCPKA
jgi:hypothetical protein